MRVLSGKRAWLECVVVLRVIGLVFAAFAALKMMHCVSDILGWVPRNPSRPVDVSGVAGQVRSASDALGAVWLLATEWWALMKSVGLLGTLSSLRSAIAFTIYTTAAVLLLSRVARSLARRLTLRERTAHG